MSLISQSIKNMVAGVSQQPQVLRMPDQAEEQVNGYSSESHGLLKRPPTQHISKLPLSKQLVDNSLVHFINRDEKEKYVAFVAPYSDAPAQRETVKGIARATTQVHDFLTPGSRSIPIPANCVNIEIFALGGGGGGGAYHEASADSTAGGASTVTHYTQTVMAAGGLPGARSCTPGAGGAPSGNPGGVGGAGYNDVAGYGGVPPANVFGGTYGHGGEGHRDGGKGSSGGGGGSGGYLRTFFTPNIHNDEVIGVTVGSAGVAVPSESHKGYPAKSGNAGAVRIIFYIEDYTAPNPDEPLVDGKIRVFDLKGTEYVVNVSESASRYLEISEGKRVGQAMRAITVADYTFILNREKVVKMTDKLSSTRPPESLIYVKQGNYGKSYKVFINGAEKASYQVPDGTSASHSVQADTSHITTELCKGLAANSIAYQAGANWIKITLGAESDTVSTADGFGDQAMFAIKRSVQKASDLPKTAPHGYIVEVAGDKTTSSDNYWLKFNEFAKTWKETVAPGLKVQLDGTTMPHALIRQGNGTFELQAIDWDDRSIGDEGSCPIPSFVGNPIKDIFFYRNRLGFVADENVILSSSGRFFKFWNNSASTITDTDPIDVAVSNNSVALLEHALPFNEELLLFAEQTQFIMRSEGVLSPKSIRVDKATDFRNSVKVRPIGVGRNAYFVMEKTGNTDLIEFFPNEEGMMDGLPLTSHVSHYVPTGITQMAGATSENMLLMGGLSGAESRNIYVYKYLFTEQGRVQSSWSKWQFASGSKVIAFAFIDAHVYLVINSESGTFLERFQTNSTVFEYPDQPWKIYLDRLSEYVIPNLEDNFMFARGSTKFNMTEIYTSVPSSGEYYAVDETGDTQKIEWDASGQVELFGDWRGKRIWVGEMFPFKYTFSRFLFKQEGQNGWVTETEGRLMLRRGHVNYADSGSFTVRVNSLSTDNYRESHYTGRTMGTFQNKLGRIPIGSGRFNYPIGREANDAKVTVTSYNPYPVAFIGAGWEGLMARRTKKA